jgi:xanthine dehydrogenase accessory factor
VEELTQAREAIEQGEIPVLVDPSGEILSQLQVGSLNGGDIHPQDLVVLVDARMTKGPGEIDLNGAALVIGLGPGFIVGQNCHAAIETKRGHTLGRVIWDGGPETDSGVPEGVAERGAERVLRTPLDGRFMALVEICSHVDYGQVVGIVGSHPVRAPFSGVLRGLLQTGTPVHQGMKIGDLDPRDDPAYCWLVSDKSLAVGGGVLEAILSRPELRQHLWT